MCDVSLEEEEENEDKNEEELPNCAVDREEDGSASICTEDAGHDRPTSSYSEEGDVTSQVIEPSNADEVSRTEGTSPALEGDVTSQLVEPSRADKDLCTDGSSPALEGGSPRSEASVQHESDRRPAAYHRRRTGSQWHDAQVSSATWWDKGAWRHGSDPWWNTPGSQRRRAGTRAWRPKA